MNISEDTKISALIKFNPKSIDVIASINNHFEKLRNPVLRKILASRVSIKDAAKIGGCSIDVFFEKLSQIGFVREEKTAGGLSGSAVSSDHSFSYPAPKLTLDVRDDLASDKDPFLKILAALNGLHAGECLLVINSFEPTPLIRILTEKNYTCSVKNESGAVLTYITKTEHSKPVLAKKEVLEDNFSLKKAEYQNRIRVLDVRHLEMPGPMISILNTLETLPDDHALFVRHRKVPHLLLPELERLGVNILIKEVSEQNVELLIY
jgi:uncharacterized protein (DUF2249 family)